MNDVEDLSAKAARLWLEFIQAQAKAAADAAKKLPEVTRSLAEAGVPFAAEMNRWVGGALAPIPPDDAPADERKDEVPSAAQAVAVPPRPSRDVHPLTRTNHRRLKTPNSMSRRRTRRA